MDKEIIKKYTNSLIENLVKEQKLISDKIDADFKNGIGMYGAGFVGEWGAKYFKSSGGNIKFFIDKDEAKNGTTLCDIEIVLPNSKRLEEVKSILIGARHAVNQVKPLYENKFNILSFDGYYVVKNYNKLVDVRENYLEDQKSKLVFNALLYAMLTGTTQSCLDAMDKDMYFSIPEFCGNFDETFVDAGAFVGDSVERFIWENLGTFKHLYAFEPGERQFNALSIRMERLINEWAIKPENVTLVKAGLSDKKDEMSCIYTGDYPLRHALSTEKTENIIETYSLDEFLNGKEVSFIKVDIEGMEMEFLKGATTTIKNFKPKMALCAYHYPCDLHVLAEYVREICPSYKFKLRHYAPLFGDFVLYCY